MRPEFIFFDLGNVLVSFDRDRAAAQVAAVTGAGVDDVTRILVDHALHDALERGRIGWHDVHAELSFRTGTRSDPADTARAASHAVFLAREKLAEAASTYPEVGVRTGVAEQGTLEMRWRTEVSDCRLPELVEAGVAGLRQISVDVTWSRGLGKKHLEMSTCVVQRTK